MGKRKVQITINITVTEEHFKEIVSSTVEDIKSGELQQSIMSESEGIIECTASVKVKPKDK